MTDASMRIARLDDAETITTVINSAFQQAEESFVVGDRINEESVRTFLANGKFLVAESDDRVVGCVYVEPRTSDDGGAYLGLLAVDPASQHSGLGSQLMDAAEDYCRELG